MRDRDHEQVLFGIKPTSVVTLTEMGHISEIQRMERQNQQQTIRKISKDEYIVLETGEIKEFNHIENRSQSMNSLRQTFKKLRYLINNNFVGAKNELHMTLTYAENMTDTERLYADFKRFMMRLKRKYKGHSIDYLNVIEPQERGAWHCHLLLRFNDVGSIFLENKKIAEMWEQGFVTIRSLAEVDNIGAYLSAYLSDIELTDETETLAYTDGTEIVEKTVEGQKKKFIKGGRLYMYPPSMKLYRKSRGIVPPTRKKMTYEDAKKVVGSAQPHYSKTYDILTDDFKNTIHFEQYNSKRV